MNSLSDRSDRKFWVGYSYFFLSLFLFSLLIINNSTSLEVLSTMKSITARYTIENTNNATIVENSFE